MEEKEKKNHQETSRPYNNKQILNVNGCNVTVIFSQEKNLLAQERVINILTQSYLNDLCKT